MTSPSARGYMSMTYDSGGSYDLLFGGANQTGAFDDTWVASSIPGVATSLGASASTVGFGAPVTLTASLAPATGPTGTVTFRNTANGQTTTLGTENVSAGTATYTGALPAVGVNALTASYSGDTAYGGSTSATVNVTVTAPRGPLTVTQLRFSGPNGGGDAYVDLQNTSSTLALPLAGWSLGVATTGGTSTVALPSGTTIPPGGHFLVTGSDYSLASVAAADLPSLPSGVTGVALDPPTSGGPATDQVGYPVTAGFYGGSGLPSLSGSPSDQYAFVRAGSQTQPTNSGDNATDFELVSTDTASFALTGGGSAQAVLGSPSPLSLTSAQQKDSLVPSTLVVPSAGSTSCPNRVVTAGGANTPTTLVINRTVDQLDGQAHHEPGVPDHHLDPAVRSPVGLARLADRGGLGRPQHRHLWGHPLLGGRALAQRPDQLERGRARHHLEPERGEPGQPPRTRGEHRGLLRVRRHPGRELHRGLRHRRDPGVVRGL